MERIGFWVVYGPHILSGALFVVGAGLLCYFLGYGREMRKTGSFETNSKGFDIRWTPEEEWWEPKAKVRGNYDE